MNVIAIVIGLVIALALDRRARGRWRYWELALDRPVHPHPWSVPSAGHRPPNNREAGVSELSAL